MDILNIFYDEFLNEASLGRIDCGFIYNVIFSANLSNKQYVAKKEELQIPTLVISNKEEFDNLLKLYIQHAYPFYNKAYYDNEHDYIKALLTFLFVNMAPEEFMDPISYIKKRIAFFNNSLDYDINEPILVGNSDYIGEISATIQKETIYEETPYSIKFKTDNCQFLTVRFGIDNNIVYIYAIQNDKDYTMDKKINRKLFKINENFDTTNESYDNINDFENLTGITNSTVTAATLALALFLKAGYTDIRMPSFLPVRYNAKEITRVKKLQKFVNEENFDLLEQESIEKNMSIQRNISDKFIRTFRRLAYHFTNINIYSYPFDIDSCLHITMNDNINCNNALLEDLFTTVYNSTKRK